MAADMHIHVFGEGQLTEDDFRIFFSNVLGSKWFQMNRGEAYEKDDALYHKFDACPNIWVGEVSWLKAALFSSPEDFIPDPVGEVNEIIGEDLPVVDDELIKKIEAALKLANNTSYAISTSDQIVEFLRKHKGKRAFTVSW